MQVRYRRKRLAPTVLLVGGMVLFVMSLMTWPICAELLGCGISSLCCAAYLTREEHFSDMDEAVRQQRLAVTRRIWLESQIAGLEEETRS